MNANERQLTRDHPRHWGGRTYVYPVISRRSRGLSVGVNLNVDKRCNFNCVYCQVRRAGGEPRHPVDLRQLAGELDDVLGAVASGSLWREPPFDTVDAEQRRLDNVAFSGDGEPTLCGSLGDCVERVHGCLDAHGLPDTPLVLITNGSRLAEPEVEAALERMASRHFQVWAKLDAGSAGLFARVNRGNVSFDRVLDGLRFCGRRRPIVLQTMCLELDGKPVTADDFEAYLDGVAGLIADGCQLAAVQLYTVAREPAETGVAPAGPDALGALAARFAARLPGLPVTCYDAS